MNGLGSIDPNYIKRRIRACNYLSVAQIFLQDNYLLERPLDFDDIKPRLLGHWGTCPGINIVYANLTSFYHAHKSFNIIIGPGHGFPALQANLFIDGKITEVDPKATLDYDGIAYICKSFSWPDGYPSHASPFTPEVICEGGELGYSLAIAYGFGLGQPQKLTAVLIGDGELETATTLSSLNLNKLLHSPANGKVLPILHLNGYKISGPTISGRKSERELKQMIRGFGFHPITIEGDDPIDFQNALLESHELLGTSTPPFLILKTDKGLTGPRELDGIKVAGNYKAHQVPLSNAKTNTDELNLLSDWLKSYNFPQLFSREKGFTI